VQPDGTLSLDRYIGQAQLRDLVECAKAEDMGPDGLDLTSDCLIPKEQPCHAVIRARQSGCLSGVSLLSTIANVYDNAITLRCIAQDGQAIDSDAEVAQIEGSLHSILAMERVALNFLCHLSGIATTTACYVAAVTAYNTKIYDTRKTLPGLRALEKYAVVCGGGHNHRSGLHDAVLIKDNHIAHLTTQDLPKAIRRACSQARSSTPSPRFVEMEVDTLEQLQCVLEIATGLIDVILLDNMSPDQLRQAVAIRNRVAATIQLEASGRITLSTVAQIAATGVNRIAIGQITHSAASLDLAMDIL